MAPRTTSRWCRRRVGATPLVNVTTRRCSKLFPCNGVCYPARWGQLPRCEARQRDERTNARAPLRGSCSSNNAACLRLHFRTTSRKLSGVFSSAVTTSSSPKARGDSLLWARNLDPSRRQQWTGQVPFSALIAQESTRKQSRQVYTASAISYTRRRLQAQRGSA